jgi:hypothetical protein
LIRELKVLRPFFLFIFHCQSAVSKSVGGCKVTNSEYSSDVILHNKWQQEKEKKKSENDDFEEQF